MPPPSVTDRPPWALEVRHLRLAAKAQFWRRPRLLLDDVSFCLAPGEVLGFLGHNGAGKTTTLKVLLGLLRPTSGEARLFGVPVGLPHSRVGLGFLPERAYYPAALSAAEFVATHARLAGLAGAAVHQAVHEALARVQLTDHATNRLGQFSKGMLQRCGLAQALLARPRLLLLDEPLDGLDPLGRQHVRSLLQQERARGCSIVLCTHVLADASALCDQVVVMRQGRVQAQGSLQQLLAQKGDDRVPVDVVVAPLGEAAYQAVARWRPQPADPEAAPQGPLHLVAANLQDAGELVDEVRRHSGTVLQLQPRQRSLEDLFGAKD